MFCASADAVNDSPKYPEEQLTYNFNWGRPDWCPGWEPTPNVEPIACKDCKWSTPDGARWGLRCTKVQGKIRGLYGGENPFSNPKEKPEWCPGGERKDDLRGLAMLRNPEGD